MRRGPCPPCQSGREMIGADFVAGRIAKIGGICSREMIARSRRAFVGAAIRDATGMKSIDLGLRGSRETNDGAVARRCFAIAWAGDDEGGLGAALEARKSKRLNSSH